MDEDGNLFIADAGNHRVRRVEATGLCHDGTLDPGEECDDDNIANGDGCDTNCTRTACGNGIQTAGEECDDQNANDGDGCSSECRIETGWICNTPPLPGWSQCYPRCGDQIIVSYESCDDGNTTAGDGCAPWCAIEPGWECAGSPSVCRLICSDGQITAPESCDDGGLAAGDGCSPTCQVERGWSCSGAPSVCHPTCGDGIVIAPETCDDGNAAGGDGCSPTCEVEVGWRCNRAGWACEPICGDGLIRGREECDDGNIANYDGCSENCVKDSDSVCRGEPSVCSRCGDGVVGAFETCDDGNLRNGDCCSAQCQPEPLDQPCPDDGDPATVDSCDVGGVCRHRATPLGRCKSADGATLSLQRTARGATRLLWKWRGTGTLPADFGDPAAGTTYRLAVYDEGGTRVAFQANFSPPALWHAIAKKGARYRSPLGWPSGITAVDLQASSNGKVKILARGKGPNLVLPQSLALSPPVTVQLSRGGSEIECWESVFDRLLIDVPSRLQARR